MEGGHIELHKMLVCVKTKAYAPDIKIFQVLYTIIGILRPPEY